MITHDEAREIVDRIYVHTDWETKDKLLAYISQQEKVSELMRLYKTEKHLAPLGVVISKSIEEEVRLNARLNVIRFDIKQLEKELGEMK